MRNQGHLKLQLECDATGSTQKECEMDWRAADQPIHAPYPNGVLGIWPGPSSTFREGTQIRGDCIAAAESET